MTYSLYILSSVQSGSIRILESCMALLSWAYPRTIGVPWIVFRGALVWLSSMAVALARPENPSILCCKGDGNIIYKISFFGFSFLLSRPRIDLSYPKFSFSHRRNVVRLSARYHDTLEQILVVCSAVFSPMIMYWLLPVQLDSLEQFFFEDAQQGGASRVWLSLLKTYSITS